MYIELNSSNYNEVVSSGVALVDFWAPWCGPCRMLAPVIDELAAEYAGKAKICKVDTEANNDLAASHGIRSIPTIMLYKDGKVVETLIGTKSKKELAGKIDALL